MSRRPRCARPLAAPHETGRHGRGRSACRPCARHRSSSPPARAVLRHRDGAVRIVAIDTGITGGIDAAQGEWLRRVSRSPKPKILLTGKPIYVNGRQDACDDRGGGTVDEIVKDPAHNYVAAIGGDIHNYQRYPVEVGGRTIQYIVAGGGGAFMHATHKIHNIESSTASSEADFRCYPLRGDSLVVLLDAVGQEVSGRLVIEPDRLRPTWPSAWNPAHQGRRPATWW